MTTKPGDKTGRMAKGAPAPKSTPQQRRQQAQAVAARTRRRARRLRWGAGLGTAIVLGAVVAWLAVGRSAGTSTTSSGPAGLPGPRGGPDVAQDVNTLVGKTVPGFALADADGTRYAVTPGRGRPLVLVFHMGIT